MPSNQAPETVELLVVGAGPVGLFAGLCAARRGLDVLIIDHVFRGYGPGHAALLHGGVLALLDDAELSARLQAQGQRIESVDIYVDGAKTTRIELPAPALAVPQNVLEEALLGALRKLGVEIRSPHQATTIRQVPEHVEVQITRRELVTLGSPADYSEWEPVDSSSIEAQFVIGADGYESRTRAALGIESVDVGRSETFAMFEFPAHLPLKEANLCYQDGLSAVMLPLPGGRARWGFQLADRLDQPADLQRFRDLVAERAPWFLDGSSSLDWGTVIQFERRLARQFGKGRVWLAGDAAHVTSPLGSHSMNVGLLEAYELADHMAGAIRSGQGPSALEYYGVERQREWHKLLGVNVSYELLPHAAPWVAGHARRLVPALPASGKDLTKILEQVGLHLT